MFTIFIRNRLSNKHDEFKCLIFVPQNVQGLSNCIVCPYDLKSVLLLKALSAIAEVCTKEKFTQVDHMEHS